MVATTTVPVKGLDEVDRLLELASPRPWIVVGDDEDCALESDGDVLGRFYTNTDDAALAAVAINALQPLLRAFRAATALLGPDGMNDAAWQGWKDACVGVERSL